MTHLLLRNEDVSYRTSLFCWCGVIDVETGVASRLYGYLSHTLVATTLYPRRDNLATLVYYDCYDDLATALATIGRLHEMMAVASRILERETHRYRTFALGVGLLLVAIAFFAVFAYGICLAQTALVGLAVGLALLLHSLGCSIQLRNICTLLVLEVFVQGVLIRRNIANRLPIDLAIPALHLLEQSVTLLLEQLHRTEVDVDCFGCLVARSSFSRSFSCAKVDSACAMD